MKTRIVLFAFLALSLPLAQATVHPPLDNAERDTVNNFIQSGTVQDGDTVQLPVATPTWTSGITVLKNITIKGAGEDQTVITEGLTPRSQSLFIVNLGKELNNNYSFRLSGIGFKSASKTAGSLGALLKITSTSTGSTDTYVQGVVKNVRLDHLKFDNIEGKCLITQSLLGVVDHCTFITSTSTFTSYPLENYHARWTPDTYKNSQNDTPKSLAGVITAQGYGSWNDGIHWGTDKFFFYEDCSVTVPRSTNMCDDLEGVRTVYRHMTMHGGGGWASHGFEGRAAAGVRGREIYNNKLIMDRGFGQTRGGSMLFFNNNAVGAQSGVTLQYYRLGQQMGDWGSTSGDCRYDTNVGGTNNSGAIVYSGKVTAIGDPSGNTSSPYFIADNTKPNWNLVDPNDGNFYGIINKSQLSGLPADSNTDPGWKYKHGTIENVSGDRLHVYSENTNNVGATFAVGNDYEIRKMSAIIGQFGHGPIRLLKLGSGGGGGAYSTYNYDDPITGPKATNPMADFAPEPLYNWNNANTLGAAGSRQKLLQFLAQQFPPLVKEGEEVFNLDPQPTTTVKVGYPAENYDGGTTTYPTITANGQTFQYKPYCYPHPIALDPPDFSQPTCGGGGPTPTPTPTPSPRFKSQDTTTFTENDTNPPTQSFLNETENFIGTTGITIAKTFVNGPAAMPANVTFTSNGNGTATWTGVANGAVAGDYVYDLVASKSGQADATQRFTLRMTNPNTAPTVAITEPTSGQAFTAPTVITLTATAGDADGQIAKVDLYNGTTIIASPTAAPYTTQLTNVPAGSYTLKAQSTDNDGATSPLVTRAVTVAPSPTPGTTATPARIWIKP